MKRFPVTIGCDLFLDLELYRMPSKLKQNLGRQFPGIRIVPVNVPGASASLEDIEIYWGNRITRQLIQNMPRLRWIHFGSAGVNRAQVPEVVRRRIAVTNSRGIMSAAVAASALSLLLALARGLHHCFDLRKMKRLTRESYDRYFSEIHDLENENCLIVGLGETGLRIARACAALGMNVRGVNTDGRSVSGVRCCRLSQLGAALRWADFTVNLLPLTQRTAGIFSARAFQSMKRSSFFINVGRGETVDEAALIRALKTKGIAGAGLDVYAREPLLPGSALWKEQRAILMPHVAGVSRNYWLKQGELMKENLRRYLSKRPLKNQVMVGKGY